MEEIKVCNAHSIHSEVLAPIKNYRNLATSFLNLRRLHLRKTLGLLPPSPLEKDLPLFDLYSMINLFHRIKYLRIPTRAMVFIQ